MNVRIFWICSIESMCAQTRARFIPSSERVLGNGTKTHVNSKEKISSTGVSEEDRTSNTASCRTASPAHYRLSYCSPKVWYGMIWYDMMMWYDITLYHIMVHSTMIWCQTCGPTHVRWNVQPFPFWLWWWVIGSKRSCTSLLSIVIQLFMWRLGV